jgi:hypothetical protein
MGVGVYLIGARTGGGIFSRLSSSARMSSYLESWFRSKCTLRPLEINSFDRQAGGRTISCQFHPAAQSILISITDCEVIIDAKTSTVGPGYHEFVCNLARELGNRFGVTWQPAGDDSSSDESGFFWSNDRTVLHREMLYWLNQVATHVSKQTEDGATALAVNLPLDVNFSSDLACMTPMGPRDKSWLSRTVTDPRQGIDLFPWWEPLRDATFHLNWALTRMWTDVRWQEPITEEDRATLDDVLNHLERGYELDPTLQFPWQEWSELIDYVGMKRRFESNVTSLAFGSQSGNRIGYRRRDVIWRNIPGHWSIRVPGSFVQDFEEDGTWRAWDHERTVRVTSLSFSSTSGRTKSAEELIAGHANEQGIPSITHREGNLIATAGIKQTQEAGEEYWVLSGLTAVPDHLAICTVAFDEFKYREWAVETWKSLSHADVYGD